jgi:hypothetical protein
MSPQCRRATLRGLALMLVANLPSIADAQAPARMPPTPPVPSKSLPVPGRVERSFDATGVKRVVVRAGEAERAEVKTIPGGRSITVSGIAEGGAAGYHPADPNWRETPASRWGLDFKARSFGPTLVVSTENEIRYIHHDYHLGGLVISVPEGVEVVKEDRKLTGEGPPDLTPPAGH